MTLEKMRVWAAAEELTAEVDALLPAVRRRAPGAADHLLRSAESVLFNTAEGVAAYRPKVKISAYEIAKKEANEVRAVLRRLVQRQLLHQPQTTRAYNLAGAVIGMLTRAGLSK